MQTLSTLLALKKLYIMQSIGVEYCDPIFIKTLQSSFKTNNLSTLHKIIQECQLCTKKSSAPYVGLCNPNSKIAFLSLTPILDHQLRFASKGAQMLKKIIENVFLLSLKDASILSLLKCDIPKTAQEESFHTCKSYLLEQIKFCKSKAIILLGQETYQYFCQDSTPYEKLQGKVLQWGDSLLLPTFSLMQLLANPQLKTKAHQEFLNLKAHL
ncbi:MAG: uracil-DNA glycosylase family protein [Helicobacter sp.]|nr:uracil-DNA glycosylase family protein [Helicobacter sp.]